jgi:hypothetical protein
MKTAYRALTDGKLVPAATGETMEVVNPAAPWHDQVFW